MNPDGELLLRVGIARQQSGVRVVSAGISSTRPHLASLLFAGRAVRDVAGMVPRLYSVCARAQGVAASLACEAGSGLEAAPEVTDARRLLIGVETVQEGLWRALIDWPRALGEEPSAKDLAAARGALDASVAHIASAAAFASEPPARDAVESARAQAQAVAGDAVSRLVLGIPHPRWGGLCSVGRLQAWAESQDTPAALLVRQLQCADGNLGASDVALLPEFDGEPAARQLASAMDTNPQFASAPIWNGSPAETGPLARMRAHPLVAAVVERFGRSALARFVARLVELCSFASGVSPAIGGCRLGPGRGLGWVETSRGLLLHHGRLDGTRVRSYQIVAPTEWNFHPRGPLARGLDGRSFEAEDALRRAVRLLVQSLDPCMAWSAEFDYA